MIGFFGGTFDPIHNGHLHAAVAAASALDLDHVALVLAAQPPHRAAPIATLSSVGRCCRLPSRDEDRLRADNREMLRDSASYTIDTLEELRVQHGASASVIWLLGWDAYRSLPTWHRWRELLQCAHLGVLRRPGLDVALDAPMQRFTGGIASMTSRRCATTGRQRLLHRRTDAVHFIHRDSRDDWVAVRTLANCSRPRVWTYIKAHRIYADPPSQP